MSSKERLSPCIIIGGPTASGKSWLGEQLAEKLNGVIINGDSMQVYKGLGVLTAQPHLDEHHSLYGILDPSKICSAAHWRELALNEIEAIYKKGKQPIVVGGTGLYLKTLMEGLSSIPPIPRDIRDDARELCDKLGSGSFHKELAKIDPKVAGTLNPGDTQRIIRAYEVIQATGKSILEWQETGAEKSPYIFYKILVLPPKSQLDERIAERFLQMLNAGALDEVKSLGELSPDCPAFKAIGVRELKAYMNEEFTVEEATDRSIIASRQLAKRQSTWFRHQFDADILIDHVPEEEDVENTVQSWRVMTS